MDRGPSPYLRLSTIPAAQRWGPLIDVFSMTRQRLRWAHGEARAAQIIEGRDPNTNRDLEAWGRVIAHGRRLFA